MKRRLMMGTLGAAAAAALTLAQFGLQAAAQENYPTKPIRIIVPEVVGSAADLLSRIIGQRIGEALGQPVRFENLFLEAGVEKGIKSAPDGYTLIYGSSGNVALLPHVKKVSFDPLKDLTPVARFVIQPTLIAANPALPVNTLQELVAMIKANPDKLRMSTAGAGTAGHFAGEMFIAMAGIKPVVVHYNGGGPAIEAVVNNDSQWTMRRSRVACRTCALESCARSPSAARRVCHCCRRSRPSASPAIRVSTRSVGAASLSPMARRSRSSTSLPRRSPTSPPCQRRESNLPNKAPSPRAAPRPKWPNCCATILRASASWPSASLSA